MRFTASVTLCGFLAARRGAKADPTIQDTELAYLSRREKDPGYDKLSLFEHEETRLLYDKDAMAQSYPECKDKMNACLLNSATIDLKDLCLSHLTGCPDYQWELIYKEKARNHRMNPKICNRRALSMGIRMDVGEIGFRIKGSTSAEPMSTSLTFVHAIGNTRPVSDVCNLKSADSGYLARQVVENLETCPSTLESIEGPSTPIETSDQIAFKFHPRQDITPGSSFTFVQDWTFTREPEGCYIEGGGVAKVKIALEKVRMTPGTPTPTSRPIDSTSSKPKATTRPTRPVKDSGTGENGGFRPSALQVGAASGGILALAGGGYYYYNRQTQAQSQSVNDEESFGY